MNKILLAMFVCMFTVSAFACGGNGSKSKTGDEKPKDAEQTEKSL